MAKFILGYTIENDMSKFTQFKNKKEANYEAEEWVEIEADSLEEAEAKYEEAFINWQKSEEEKYKSHTQS